MKFDRRIVLKGSAVIPLAAALPRWASAAGDFNPQPGPWRTFQIVTRLEIAKPEGKTQAWVPVPAVNEADWFKSLGSDWTSNGKAELVRDPKYGSELVHVEWASDEAKPAIEVISKISTRDRAVDLTKPGNAKPLSAADHRFYTEGSELIPVDGIVKETSDKIVADVKTDVEKVSAIYEWIVANTFRDGKVRGCGIGDIASMLKTGNLGGKCADLNALYVGLVRAAGIPARDVYGIRVAPSKFGYRSLGANSEIITKAQHCRAETFVAGHGWIATDPADVRKVVLEEPPGTLPIDNPKVVDARKTLFGAWEGNWLAYNFAHDVALPGSKGPKLGFLMYPQAECGPARLDCLDPDNFKYTIVSKELTSA
ncbi:MAG TPA: transglutaminase family protein [Pseudolabrys sp.]|nr:transglutaminase family protein [Pseudolabrys sp.]